MLEAGGPNDPPYQQHLYESRTQSMKQKQAESLEDTPTILIIRQKCYAKSQRMFQFLSTYAHNQVDLKQVSRH